MGEMGDRWETDGRQMGGDMRGTRDGGGILGAREACSHGQASRTRALDDTVATGNRQLGRRSYGGTGTAQAGQSSAFFLSFFQPSLLCTTSPTISPTVSHTASPTVSPTISLTIPPTTSPTVSPTISPTVSPTISHTVTGVGTACGLHAQTNLSGRQVSFGTVISIKAVIVNPAITAACVPTVPKFSL